MDTITSNFNNLTINVTDSDITNNTGYVKRWSNF